MIQVVIELMREMPALIFIHEDSIGILSSSINVCLWYSHITTAFATLVEDRYSMVKPR